MLPLRLVIIAIMFGLFIYIFFLVFFLWNCYCYFVLTCKLITKKGICTYDEGDDDDDDKYVNRWPCFAFLLFFAYASTQL